MPLVLRGKVAYVSNALLSGPEALFESVREVVFPQMTRPEIGRDGTFVLVSSDGVDAGVRDAPRVLDAALDLEESLLTALPPRCARSLLISVVSADGNESGNTLVLVLGTEDGVVLVGLDAALLLLDRDPYAVAAPRLPTGVLTSATSEELADSRPKVVFSRDLGRSRSLSLLLAPCTLLRIFRGVAVRDLERGVAAPKLVLEVALLVVCFARTLFCEEDSAPHDVFFFVVLEVAAVLFTLIRLVRTDTLPAMDELSLPPSLVPSPPVAPSRTSSGSVDPHGSS